MKNSLFKRAIAAVATVPLALTQCLGVANAITVDDSAVSVKENSSVLTADDSDKSVKLTGKGGLLYINPDEELAKYELQADGTTFIQDSVWNVKAYSIFSNIEKKSGTLDMQGVYNEALKDAGEYKRVVQNFIDKLSEFTYSIDADGNITVEASVSNIVPKFTNTGADKTVGGALKKIANKYNVPELRTDLGLFDSLQIAGKGKLVINAESLQSSTELGVKFTFTDADGKVWNGADALTYIENSYENLKNCAKQTVQKYADKVDIDDAYAIIDEEMDFYENKVKWIHSEVDAYSEGDFSFKADTVSDALTALKNRLEKTRIAKYNFYTNNKGAIPTSGEEAANKDWVKRVFGAFVKNVKSLAAPYTVDFTLDDLGTEIDRVTDISATLTKSQTGTASAVYPDDEFNEVVSYFATAYPEYEVISSHKEVSVDADYSNLYASANNNVSVDVEYVRVVEVKPIETTTTTTETTVSTTTETTTVSDDTDKGSTTSETTTVSGDIDTGSTTSETTTVSGDIDTGSTTSETTTVSGDIDTGSTTSETTTVSGDIDTGSTTSETTTVSGDIDTGSTTTETTTTETGVVGPGSVYAVATASTVDGYYFSHDSRPFDKGHVENSINIVVVDEEGIPSDPTPIDMSKVTFKEEVSGADNPAGAFKGPNALKSYTIEDFCYKVFVLYNNEQLTYENGEPVSFKAFIGVKGDANFDMIVDSGDASSVLGYYAERSRATSDEERDNVRLSPNSCELVNLNPELDEFAAFLVDVDLDVYSEGNWKMAKKERTIDAPDASSILSFYSNRSVGTYASYTDNEIWNLVFKDREEQMRAILS